MYLLRVCRLWVPTFPNTSTVLADGAAEASGFTRRALQSSDGSKMVFSTKADVYSYGMTCYEILTGKLPFEGHPMNDYDIVLKEGQRPEVPEYVDDWVRELLGRFWQDDPAGRPSFGEIMNLLSANSAAVRDSQAKLLQFERDRGFDEKLIGVTSSGATPTVRRSILDEVAPQNV